MVVLKFPGVKILRKMGFLEENRLKVNSWNIWLRMINKADIPILKIPRFKDSRL